MSRYGGHTMVIGKGKASNEKLPKDQSLKNMFDNYATEIISQHFFISSYDALPEFMGGMDKLYFPKTVKLGTIEHRFNEVFIQYDTNATTDIYIANHQYSNLYSVFIKTHKESLKWVVDEYQERYDYVLLVLIRDLDLNYDQSLSKNTGYIEKILLILFYKMGLKYEGDMEKFNASKTNLGKKISREFKENINKKLVGIETDDDLSKILLEYENIKK